MVERKMDLEETTRHYNEQLERINEWKRKNLDISHILEMRTVTDFINAYDEGISSLEEDGVPEEVLVTLRKERDELGKRLAETEYRIKRLERTKEAEENRYGYAQSVLTRWVKEANEDRLDTQTQFDMEISFLSKIRDHMVDWTGDRIEQLAAWVNMQARARSVRDIGKADKRIENAEKKMAAIKAQSARRIRFRRKVWSFRRAMGLSAGREPVEGYMSATEMRAYKQYEKERDDHIKERADAVGRKERAEKDIFRILDHRPDLLLKSQYVLLDEELQEDLGSWYQKFSIFHELQNDAQKSGIMSGTDRESEEKAKDHGKKREITNRGQTDGIHYFIERGAGRPPRAYISIPAGTGADALGELRDRPMDSGRRTHTIPKTIRGLFGPHLINIVRKDLPDMARSSGEEGKGRFAVLEFREKGTDGKWKAFKDGDILSEITEAAKNCHEFNKTHSYEEILAGNALAVTVREARKSCEYWGADGITLPIGAGNGKDAFEIRIEFDKDGRPSYFVEGKEADRKDVIAMIGDPRAFVKEAAETIRNEDARFVEEGHDGPGRKDPEERGSTGDKEGSRETLRDWQRSVVAGAHAVWYDGNFKSVDPEMKIVSLEFPARNEPSGMDEYGVCFSEKGFPSYSLNGKDVTKEEFISHIEKDGPGMERFLAGFAEALKDKKEQLTDFVKTKKLEKETEAPQGRGE